MDKTFKQFCESILDVVQRTVSPELFDDIESSSPKLKQTVIDQIMVGVHEFEKISPIVKLKMIGSSLTHQYTNDSDIDVNIGMILSPTEYDTYKSKIRDMVIYLNGRLVPGTQHPVNYYVNTTSEDTAVALQRADAVLDIRTNTWDKHPPKSPVQIHVGEYLEKFHDVISNFDILSGKFQRDLVDFKKLPQINIPDDAKNIQRAAHDKLIDLDLDIHNLINAENDVAVKRRAMFARDLTRDELSNYGTYNRMPENILYKILERYHYLDLIEHLRGVIGEGELTIDQANQL